MERRFLRTPEAAAYVGLSPRTLEALRVQGGGPHFLKPTPGHRVVLYDVADLERWARRGACAAGEPIASACAT